MIVVTTQAIVKRILSRFRSRVLEWEHAIIMTLWGVIVVYNPTIFNDAGYVAFVGGSLFWGSVVIIAGLVRISALCVNGYMARPTALVRAFAAASGILMFAAISLGFLFSWRWSTALAVYPVLGFFGLFSLYWSIFDVAIPDDHSDDST